MKILETIILYDKSYIVYGVLCFIGVVIAAIFFGKMLELFCTTPMGRDITLAIGLAIIIGLATAGMVLCCSKVPCTNVKKYIVKITDKSAYEQLVRNNYSVSTIYPDEEIYEIIGAPLEEEEST